MKDGGEVEESKVEKLKSSKRRIEMINPIDNRFQVCNEDGRAVATRGFRKHFEALKAARQATKRSGGSLYIIDTMARVGSVFAMKATEGAVDDFFPRRERAEMILQVEG